MSPDEDSAIAVETHDLARLYALEQMTSVLWLCVSAQTAEAQGSSVSAVAKEYREGVLGSMAEGRLPPAFLALMRHHAAKVMDQAVAHAQNAEALSGGKPG